MEDVSIEENSVETVRPLLIDTATEVSEMEDLITEEKAVETTRTI